jgi:hypothetical protein
MMASALMYILAGKKTNGGSTGRLSLSCQPISPLIDLSERQYSKLSMASLAVSVWVVQNHYTYAASVAATFFLFFYMEFPPRL